MANLIPFHFNTHEVRVQVDDHGQPWWIATDVGAALEHSNVSMLLKRVDEDEKTLSSIYPTGPDAWFINESGLYNLILGSRKPEAKAFKRWVTHEVIPQIRKTGKYEPEALMPVSRGDLLVQMAEAYRLQEYRLLEVEAAHQEHQRQLLQQQADIIASQRQALEALQSSQRAESKADVALDDRRMTIEEFVLKNGLLPQHPPASWKGVSTWLTRFCLDYGLRVEKSPVVGKLWPDEWSYPLQAFGRWLDYERRKPTQIRLVHITEGA